MRQIEAAQAITSQRIGTTLENNGARTVPHHDVLNDRFKDGMVTGIIDTVTQGHIDRVVLALAVANVADVSGPGEKLAELVERHGHDSVGRVEGFLDAVSVMHVNVNVQDSIVISMKKVNTSTPEPSSPTLTTPKFPRQYH